MGVCICMCARLIVIFNFLPNTSNKKLSVIISMKCMTTCSTKLLSQRVKTVLVCADKSLSLVGQL